MVLTKGVHWGTCQWCTQWYSPRVYTGVPINGVHNGIHQGCTLGYSSMVCIMVLTKGVHWGTHQWCTQWYSPRVYTGVPVNGVHNGTHQRCTLEYSPRVYTSPRSVRQTMWSLPEAILTTTAPGRTSTGAFSMPRLVRPIDPLASCNPKHTHVTL